MVIHPNETCDEYIHIKNGRVLSRTPNTMSHARQRLDDIEDAELEEEELVNHAALGSDLRAVEIKMHAGVANNTASSRDQSSSQFSSSIGKARLFAGHQLADKGNDRNANSSFNARRGFKDSDLGTFEKHTKGFGMKMLMKMGYKYGKGLGNQGQGIIAPVEVQQRPKAMGIGFDGFDEISSQTKKEKQRQNQESSSPKILQPKRNAWEKSTEKKQTSTTYKRASDIMLEAEGEVESMRYSTKSKIFDMTGLESCELSSLADIKSLQKLSYGTAARLPELRQNLRQLADLGQHDIEHITTQKRLDKVQQDTLNRQVQDLHKVVQDESAAIERLSCVIQIAKECERQMKLAGGALISMDTDIFDQLFRRLQVEYYDEYIKFRLDRMVVALVAPLARRVFHDWSPLEEPHRGIDFFRKWKTLLQAPSVNKKMISKNQHFEDYLNKSMQTQRMFTDRGESETVTSTSPYESLLWNIWLPPIRSWINHEWNVRQPDVLIDIIDAWYPSLLPPVIYDNVIDQLVLPKLTAEINASNPRKDNIPMYQWLHPWLPYVGDHIKSLIPSLRYKLSVSLDDWHPSNPLGVANMEAWSDLWTRTEVDAFLSRYVTPKLISVLRDEFIVDPASQDLDPLNWVLAWQNVYGAEPLSRVLEATFTPTWLTVLHEWLTSPGANFDEIAQWFSVWKAFFSHDLSATSAMQNCFRFGLDMMNQALSGLPITPPELFLPVIAASAITGGVASFPGAPPPSSFVAPTLTFRDLVESVAEQNGYMLTPTDKLHERTGKPIWRFGDGNKALLLYMESEVVFVRHAGEWIPCALHELPEKLH